MTKSTRVTLVPIVVAGAGVLLIGVVAACNGILGNEVLTADAGFAAMPDTGPAERCPGQKYCSAIDSCGSKSDPSYGCSSASCEPCQIPNATATCGGTGCTVGACFPGFRVCVPGKCSDLSEPATCGKCGTACKSPTPFCAASTSPEGFDCVATCPVGQDKCDTLDHCYDLTKSVNHCGDCRKGCRDAGSDPPNGIASCVSSTCQLDCFTGFRKCGPADKQTCERVDGKHCGPLCTICPPAPNSTPGCAAQGGNYTCSYTCDTSTPPSHDYVKCGGVTGCVDIDTDPAHCGGCNKSCVINPTSSGVVGGTCTCVAGLCGPGCKAI